MSVSRLLVVVVAVGIVANVYDFLVNGVLLQGVYGQEAIMRKAMSLPMLVVFDFVAALVFVWVYQRVRASFGPGASGGAVFGLYAAILVNFPTWIFAHLLLEGFSSKLALVWTLAGIGWGVVAGAVAGALSDRGMQRVS